LVITGSTHVAVLFSVHHSISDAYSFFYFIVNALCQKESHSNAVPTYVTRPWYSMTVYLITFPFQAAWEIAGLFVKTVKRNALKAGTSFDIFQLNGSQGSNLNIAVTQSLPISLVKDVKSHYKTSFAAVQQSVLTGAITEWHQEKGIHLPRATPCFTVLPFPGHKLDKFQNHAYGRNNFNDKLVNFYSNVFHVVRRSAAFIYLPTSKTDPIKLLHLTTHEYNRCKQSTLPTVFFHSWGLAGCFVSSIVQFGLRRWSFPTGISSVPAGLENAVIFDCKAIDAFGFGGLPDKFGGYEKICRTFFFQVSPIFCAKVNIKKLK